jgi:hypothetical protein
MRDESRALLRISMLNVGRAIAALAFRLASSL